MMRRKVEDVMTRSVAYATKDTPYKELIRLLAERRVSALPVVGAERQVLGVVAEAARLLRKHLVRRLPVVDRLAAGRHREPLGPAAGVPAPGPRDPPGGRGRGDPGGSADGPGPIPGQRR